MLWAADNAQVPAETAQVVYTASELRDLVGLTPDRLRAIHAVKKALDCELMAVGADDVATTDGSASHRGPQNTHKWHG